MGLTVLLASSYILWPVTCMRLLIVQEAADAELLSGCAVPAGPVAGARSLMAKNSIQPVTVVGCDRWVWGDGKIEILFQTT